MQIMIAINATVIIYTTTYMTIYTMTYITCIYTSDYSLITDHEKKV